MSFRHVGTRKLKCWLPSLGFRVVLWGFCLLYVAILGVGAYEAYTTKEVDSAWPVLCLAFLWMMHDISKTRP
jgi:hypothetical protein